ncbi:4-carboxymuconolactone decarboxylase [Rhodococcus sp. RD6.2]|jgi:alkylhydroperoxidase/carboxymuconolactone decarboxylase family protein YurZ|uniref:carboxymuconolactone decarboxylase family protein n=1 Tax=Rhodococcus sp. RD6.2 TaxID=260936 RepID=UPI00063B4594|nr:carboxymuconolactone decarboxylase family protein [Rhodococcus sp. RD6.2]CRK52743.1 4-carboxymuconolactone decarboxylase [Rhodococcus sp. RD6.2]
MNTNSEPPHTPTIDGMRRSGNWNPLWDTLSDWDPEWTEQFMAMNATPIRRGVFSPEFVELLSIAIDAAATHMYAPGVRRHIRAALELGVSREEILTVLQMVSVLGIHACNLGVPILEEELDAFESRRAAS